MTNVIEQIKKQGILLLSFFALSIISHSFPLYQMIKEGILFTGKIDGLAQIIPFHIYLYEKFTSFNFFYNMDFGLGGDFFRSLAYYFSTSPIAYLNYFFIYIGDFIFDFNTDQPEFWAVNQIIISILKLTLIFFFTYKLIRYYGFNKLSALSGSFVYGCSAIFFQFSMLFDFFADTMIYLPIIVYGIERLFKEKKPLLFIVGLALSLHSNFYFSYYIFIFMVIYFIYRVIIPYKNDQLKMAEKLWITTASVLLGLMISSVGFFTGVSGYIRNTRNLVAQPSNDWFNHETLYNIFYYDEHFYISIFIITSLFTIKLIKNYYYKLYVIFTLFFIFCTFSPVLQSMFNGFTTPTHRFGYLFTFVSGIMVAMFIHILPKLKLFDIILSLIPTILIFLYYKSLVPDKSLYWTRGFYIIVSILIIYTIFKFLKYKSKSFIPIIATMVMITNCIGALENYYWAYSSEESGLLSKRSFDYINSPYYDSLIQRHVTEELDHMNPNSRIDYVTNFLQNTPMLQGFNGVMLYSSIIDKNKYHFQDVLNIAPSKNMSSIYNGFDDRPNLLSLYNVNYFIRYNQGFKKPDSFNMKYKYPQPGTNFTYYVYENQYPIPFVRITKNIVDEDDLKDPIQKERAMLQGIVLKDVKSNFNIQPTKNLLSSAKLIENNAKFSKDKKTVKVSEDGGGIVLYLPKETENEYEDLYIDLEVYFKDKLQPGDIFVNEVNQHRYGYHHEYARDLEEFMPRIKSSDFVKISLPKGEHHLDIRGIYGTDYNVLKKVSKDSPTHHQFVNNGDDMTIKLGYHEGGYVVIPIPYLDGFSATVDGKPRDVKSANYLMTAIKVKKGEQVIHLSYKPPYFHLMQFISILGIILTFLFSRYLKSYKINII